MVILDAVSQGGLAWSQKEYPTSADRVVQGGTKRRILAELKREGACTIGSLAGALGLAPMTVRQHLATLERDGLVHGTEQRGTVGRPSLRYVLTDAGAETFPRRYDELAALLLATLAGPHRETLLSLPPERRADGLWDLLADRAVEPFLPRLERLPPRQRIHAAAAVLDCESGLVDVRVDGARVELVDYNCPYRRVACEDPRVCAWHERVVSRLVGSEVAVVESQCTGSNCCRFVFFITDEATPVVKKGTEDG